MTTENISVERFANEDAKRSASVDVFKNILEVMFFYLEENEENLEEEGQLDDFTDFLWAITTSAMSSTNINIIGKDEKGRYIATLEPYSSVKEFLIKEDIGVEDYVFYEDYVESLAPDSGFGRHDDKIMRPD